MLWQTTSVMLRRQTQAVKSVQIRKPYMKNRKAINNLNIDRHAPVARLFARKLDTKELNAISSGGVPNGAHTKSLMHDTCRQGPEMSNDNE
jgi:hypothetical protein